MRGSAKGAEPPELCSWKLEQCRNGIRPEYGNLQQPERGATVRSLFAEQTGQCVYCGRQISLAVHQRYHIEHFRPQSKYHALELDYTNLFLSCGPDSEDGTQNTCGNHKGNWFQEDCHIPPAPESCADSFRFGASGRILADDLPEADKMIQVLNLNHPELVIERQEMIEDLDSELNAGIKRELLCQSFLDKDNDGARPSFANVAVKYLEQQSYT